MNLDKYTDGNYIWIHENGAVNMHVLKMEL